MSCVGKRKDTNVLRNCCGEGEIRINTVVYVEVCTS